MPVDLHTHSRASDGSDSPRDVVDRASELGLRAVALTDHDTFDGIDEATRAAAECTIELIPGTELSVEWATGAMHLLVYFVDEGSSPLSDAMRQIRRGRADRNERMVERLREIGIDISYEEVAAESRTGVTGRPHFAAVLVAKGVVPDIPTAFDRYLAAGRPGYVPRTRLAAEDAVRLARESGGVPVIAHPHTIGAGAADYERAFRDLAAVGLGGIECYYSEYAPELREHLAGVAHDLGLAATGGSDYHGSYKAGLELGRGRGDLVVPDASLDELYEARAR